MTLPLPDPWIGRQVGNYRIVEKKGEGGHGAVYLASHPILRKKFAIKFLLQGGVANPVNLERFFQEARAASEIEHPRIVAVIDSGYTEDGCAYQVMPFIEGRDLDKHAWEVGAQWGHPGRLPHTMAIDITLQVADALAAAHAKGIIHRGANVIIDGEGVPVHA